MCHAPPKKIFEPNFLEKDSIYFFFNFRDQSRREIRGGLWGGRLMRLNAPSKILSRGVILKHDGTEGSDGTVNTDGTAIERADGSANTGVN